MSQLVPKHRPTVQIERELAELRHTPAPPIPDLSRMNLKLARLSAEAQVDPKKRGELSDALMDIQEAEQVMQAIGSRNTNIRALEVELELAQMAERAERIASADEQLGQAVAEFKHAALAAAKAYRTMLTAQKQAANVPGASHKLPPQLLGFHVGFLHPLGWQGTLGETMQSGEAQFENNRHLRVA